MAVYAGLTVLNWELCITCNTSWNDNDNKNNNAYSDNDDKNINTCIKRNRYNERRMILINFLDCMSRRVNMVNVIFQPEKLAILHRLSFIRYTRGMPPLGRHMV